MSRVIVAGLLAGLLTTGCTPKPYMGKSRDLHAEMGSRREAVEAPQLTPSPAALGPEAPYLPLVQPPEVRRVWVTAHLNDAGDMIAGHWVYLMLEPSSVVPELPGTAGTEAETAGKGAHRAAAGPGAMTHAGDRTRRPPAVWLPAAARPGGGRPRRRHYPAAGAAQPARRRPGMRLEGRAEERRRHRRRCGRADGGGPAGALSQPGAGDDHPGAHAHGSDRPGGRVVGVSQERSGHLQPQRVPGSVAQGRPGARRRRETLATQGDHDAHDGKAFGAHSRHQAAAAGHVAVPKRAEPAQGSEPADRDCSGTGGRRA